MDWKLLRELRDQAPFEPFRIVMADRRTYDVRHPELLVVGSRVTHLGVADEKEDYILADHMVRLVNAHITTTIPLTVADQVGQSAT